MSFSFRSALLITLLLCLGAANALWAQQNAWSVDLQEQLSAVNWIEQANDGTLIVAGDKGLMGIKNTDGSTVWSLPEINGVDRNTFFNVEGLPLFYVEYAPLVGKRRGLIISPDDGSILYDTKEDNIRIKSYTFLPEKNSLLFEGTSGDNLVLINFDISTLSSLWVADLGKKTGVVDVLKNISGSESFITQGPMVTKNGDLILGIKDQIYRVNFDNGDVSWNQETDKKIKALVYSPVNNSLYLGIRKSKKLTVLDPSDGSDITPGKLKLKGTMLDVVSANDGSLVLVETEGFNLIDPQTNEFKWKKSYKIEYLDEVIPFEKGFLAIGKDEKNSEVHYVDASGDKIWDSKVKGYAYFAAPMQKGLMYISTERSNILNFENGKDVWDKDVKFRAIPAVAAIDDDNVFLYEGGTAYEFNMATGKIKVLAEKLDLEHVTKKTPLVAEATDAGYFVHADQEISFIDKQGKLVYTSYYKPMKKMDFTGMANVAAGLAGVDIDIAGSVDNFKALKQLSSNSSGKQTGSRKDFRENEGYVSASVNGVTTAKLDLYSYTSTRYFNAQQTKDEYFLTAKSDDGTRRAIYRINKATGEVVQEIELTDQDPSYVIDQVDGMIYIAEKGKTLRAVKM